MTVESAVAAYGYPALFIAAMFEGETGVVIAGFLAHRGYLDLSSVVAIAWAGAWLSDQLFFRLGRWRGGDLFARNSLWEGHLRRVRGFILRNPLLIVFSYRFMYGFQKITPAAVGMSGYPALRFAGLTLLSSALWAGVISSVGYFFGGAVHTFFAGVRRYEVPLLLGLAAAGGGVWLYRRRRCRRLETGERGCSDKR